MFDLNDSTPLDTRRCDGSFFAVLLRFLLARDRADADAVDMDAVVLPDKSEPPDRMRAGVVSVSFTSVSRNSYPTVGIMGYGVAPLGRRCKILGTIGGSSRLRSNGANLAVMNEPLRKYDSFSERGRVDVGVVFTCGLGGADGSIGGGEIPTLKS